MVQGLKGLRASAPRQSLYAILLCLLITEQQIEAFVSAFEWLDKDGDGTVSPAEMQEADTDLGDIFGLGDNWKEVFEQMDTSGDG